MLGEINNITKVLHTSLYALSQCRDALDILIESVQCDSENPTALLYRCKFVTLYIAPSSDIVAYPDFESAVTKIQKGMTNQLFKQGKRADVSLKKRNTMKTSSTGNNPFSSF